MAEAETDVAEPDKRVNDRRGGDRRASERREDARPYRQIVAEATALERVGKWTAAAILWDSAVAAARRAKSGTKEAIARAAAARAVGAAGGDVGEAVRAVAGASAREKRESHLANRERTRVEQHGLHEGDVVQHTYRGEVRAECEYRGERQWVYNGKTYDSISAAANAAAIGLKMKSKTLNGWLFWRVEKREP